MRQLVTTVGAVLGRLWWWTRQVSGDAAYENYLRRAARRPGHCARSATRYAQGGGRADISRQQFYLESLKRRFSGVTRCC